MYSKRLVDIIFHIGASLAKFFAICLIRAQKDRTSAGTPHSVYVEKRDKYNPYFPIPVIPPYLHYFS